MITLLTVTAELVFVVCIAAAIPFVLLTFRNEHRSKMLHRGSVEAVAANLIAIGIAFSLGFLINGFVGAGMNTLYAIILAGVLFFIFSIAVWKAFNVNERLRQADAGQSPFYLPGWLDRGPPPQGGTGGRLGGGAAA